LSIYITSYLRHTASYTWNNEFQGNAVSLANQKQTKTNKYFPFKYKQIFLSNKLLKQRMHLINRHLFVPMIHNKSNKRVYSLYCSDIYEYIKLYNNLYYNVQVTYIFAPSKLFHFRRLKQLKTLLKWLNTSLFANLFYFVLC
jgi:hypothetical protein